MKANKAPDGFLFAIVNSRETVIQLGVKVSSLQNNLSISIVYNDPSTTLPLESIATFVLPYEPKHWINFSLQIMNNKIILYHNCVKVHEENITREPRELVFESASTFYLAQAGNSKQKFEVSFPIFHGNIFFLLKFVISKIHKVCHSLRVISNSLQNQLNIIHVDHAFSCTFIYPANQNNLPLNMRGDKKTL